MALKAKSTASEKAAPAKRSKPSSKGGGRGSTGGSGSGAQKIVSALALLKEVHQLEEAPKERVAKMAGIPNATLPSLLSRLKSKGCIEYGAVSGTLKVTDKGMEMVDPNLHFPSTNAEHQEAIKAQLKGKALQVFEILMDGEIHDKQDIMEAIDCTNPKTFAPMMSRELASKGYIHYPSKGIVQLHPDCFPFDREE